MRPKKFAASVFLVALSLALLVLIVAKQASEKGWLFTMSFWAVMIVTGLLVSLALKWLTED